MVTIGFHPELVGLEAYFERKTNWQPDAASGSV